MTLSTPIQRVDVVFSTLDERRARGRSTGGPHDLERAVADLETVRAAAGIDRWIALGHSWGSDLAVRYALEAPDSVTAVIGIAGRGPQRERLWSEAYEAGRDSEPGRGLE